jgi:hypothetical protein
MDGIPRNNVIPFYLFYSLLQHLQELSGNGFSLANEFDSLHPQNSSLIKNLVLLLRISLKTIMGLSKNS